MVALRLYGSTALRLYGQCPVIHIRTANQAGLVEGMPSLGKLQLKPNSKPSIVSVHKKIAEHKFRDFFALVTPTGFEPVLLP